MPVSHLYVTRNFGNLQSHIDNYYANNTLIITYKILKKNLRQLFDLIPRELLFSSLFQSGRFYSTDSTEKYLQINKKYFPFTCEVYLTSKVSISKKSSKICLKEKSYKILLPINESSFSKFFFLIPIHYETNDPKKLPNKLKSTRSLINLQQYLQQWIYQKF